MEHLKLQNSPYAWSMTERELGIVDVERTPKLLGKEMKRIGDMLSSMHALAQKDVDVTCVLSKEKRFAKAGASYILAKQAGFNINITTDFSDATNAYIVTAINYSDKPQKLDAEIKAGYRREIFYSLPTSLF